MTAPIDIIAARAAGGLADTPWNTVVTELCKRVEQQGARIKSLEANVADHEQSIGRAREQAERVYGTLAVAGVEREASEPADAPEPEAPAVLWAVIGPHDAAWAVAQTHEDCTDAADRYRGVYPGDVYAVRRYRLDDARPAVPEGMVEARDLVSQAATRLDDYAAKDLRAGRAEEAHVSGSMASALRALTESPVPEGMVMVDVDKLLEAVASEGHASGRLGAPPTAWPDMADVDREWYRKRWRARLVRHGILPEPTP